jgi:hypothetical protein
MLEDKIKKYKSINKFNIDSMLMLKNKIKNKRERERGQAMCASLGGPTCFGLKKSLSMWA